MISEVLAEDRAFSVVLIERGAEVGGGDIRFDVGTLAGISWVQQMGAARLVLSVAPLDEQAAA